MKIIVAVQQIMLLEYNCTLAEQCDWLSSGSTVAIFSGKSGK